MNNDRPAPPVNDRPAIIVMSFLAVAAAVAAFGLSATHGPCRPVWWPSGPALHCADAPADGPAPAQDEAVDPA